MSSTMDFPGQDGSLEGFPNLGPDPNGFDQDSIDAFLGLAAGVEEKKATGIDALFDNPTVPYARIPVLEAVFDRLTRLLRTSARKITSDLVEVRLDRITSVRFGQYLDTIPLPSLVGVVKAEQWNGHGLVTLNSSLVYSLTDVVFGGTASLVPPVDGRAFSNIEVNMLKRFLDIVLTDCTEAFSAISPIDFTLEHCETNPRFASITQPQNVVLLATLKMEFGSLQGFFDIVLPFVTLEPIRQSLSLSYLGDDEHDNGWKAHFATEAARSKLDLSVLLCQRDLPLGRILKLAVGDTLMLDMAPDDAVVLRCGPTVLAHGRMGRVGDNVAFRFTEAVHARSPDGEDRPPVRSDPDASRSAAG